MPPPKPKTRGSLRIAKKNLQKYASTLPAQKRKRIESMLKKSNNVWMPVVGSYNVLKGNTSARNVVSTYFHPTVRKYNVTKNKFLTGKNANRAIQRSITHKNIANMLVPLHGVKRGGVNPAYVVNALKTANVKYAIVNDNGKLRSLALLKNNTPNSRYINVISAFTSYGHPMMNKILANAKSQGKKRVNLQAVTNTTNNKAANSNALVKWYAAKGFKRSGVLGSNQLLPMTHRF
jgi:hypothetical protein